MVRHQQVNTRAILLIASVLAFIVAFYSLPLSNAVYNEHLLYYQYGAKGHARFGGIGYYNQSTVNQIEKNYEIYFDGISPYIILESDILNEFTSFIRKT